MKNKVVAMSVIGVLLFGGVVGASSINGDYKGNPIVKVNVNGTTLNPEVPAQIVDGSTLLPLKAVSEAFGANINWNPETYSVDVTLTNNVELLKLYSRISQTYTSQSVLAGYIYDLATGYSTAYSSIRESTEPDKYLTVVVNELNRQINLNNSLLPNFTNIAQEAQNAGIALNDIVENTVKIQKIIDQYKSNLDILYAYKDNKNTNLQSYFDSMISSTDEIYAVQISTAAKAYEYFKMIQGIDSSNPVPPANTTPIAPPSNRTPIPAPVIVAPPATESAIETKIDGDFEGWDGETIFKLANGQIWQQTEYNYHYHYAFSPKVVIYKSGSGYKMKVDGVDKAIGVKRIK